MIIMMMEEQKGKSIYICCNGGFVRTLKLESTLYTREGVVLFVRHSFRLFMLAESIKNSVCAMYVCIRIGALLVVLAIDLMPTIL